MHEEEIRSLAIRYDELHQLFEQRPSRSEDIDLIQRLQNDNNHKTEELKKAVENLKFFKLELLNREESYNKHFGASPTIGVLNPLEKVTRISAIKF